MSKKFWLVISKLLSNDFMKRYLSLLLINTNKILNQSSTVHSNQLMISWSNPLLASAVLQQ